MYIGEVRVTNFLSYRSEQAAAGLSPGVNVVIGRNGSGKSNFFAAIRFVLAGIQRTSYEQLRYAGPGANFDNARVDVVFMDAAEQFGKLGSTVTVSREVVRTTSRYLLNGKPVTQTRVRTVLDVAGLTLGANTLYIVPQGEVTLLATASYEERLSKLLAVAGALSFDTRLAEAQQTLGKSDATMRDVTGNLRAIAANLDRFKRDVDRLNAYLAVQARLAGAQYCCLRLQIRKSVLVADVGRTDLDALDARAGAGTDVYARLAVLQKDAAQRRMEVLNLEAERDQLRLDVRTESAALQDRASTLALAELALAQRSPPPSQGSQSLSQSLSGSQSVAQSAPAATEESVAAARERVSAGQSALADAKRDLDALEAQIRAIKLKQGRFDQLSGSDAPTQRARQEQHLAALRAALPDVEQRERRAAAALSDSEKALATCRQRLEEARDGVTESYRAYDSAFEAERAAKDAQTARERERNLAIQSARKAELASASYLQIADEAATALAFARASTVEGVKEVVLKVRSLDVPGYRGTVADVVRIDPAALTAAVSVAGARLLYHVIEASAEGDRVLTAVQKSGASVDASFIALDTVVVQDAPAAAEPYATPLLDFVSVDAGLEKVARLLFGRHVLCDTLEHAYAYARKHNVPTVTLEGDLCDPAGPLTGGAAPLDAPQTRIEQIRRYVDYVRQSLEEADATARHRAEGERLTQEILKHSAALRSLEAARIEAAYRKQDAESRVADLRDVQERLGAALVDARAELDAAHSELDALQTEIAFVSDADNFAGAASQTDVAELARLEDEHTRQFSELTELKRTLDADTDALAQQRRALVRQQAVATAATAGAFSFSQPGQPLDVDELRESVESARARVAELQAALDGKEITLADLRDELQQVHDECEALESTTRVTHNSKKKLAKKLHAMQQFREECERELKALKSVPESAVEEMSDVDTLSKNEVNQLLARYSKQQSELESELTGFDAVNRKASEQYESYLQQHTELEARRERLVAEKAKIVEAIDLLKKSKTERVEKLITDLTATFPKIYAKLSDGGRASLDVRRSGDTYEGIGTQLENGFSMNQLSGGQKTIMAIALILAVQACDPSPFYIFDEIDANLDAAARGLVAAAIEEMARTFKSQCICTTFGTELVEVADKCYGVSFQNQESSIMEIEKDLARDFVDPRAWF